MLQRNIMAFLSYAKTKVSTCLAKLAGLLTVSLNRCSRITTDTSLEVSSFKLLGAGVHRLSQYDIQYRLCVFTSEHSAPTPCSFKYIDAPQNKPCTQSSKKPV